MDHCAWKSNCVDSGHMNNIVNLVLTYRSARFSRPTTDMDPGPSYNLRVATFEVPFLFTLPVMSKEFRSRWNFGQGG